MKQLIALTLVTVTTLIAGCDNTKTPVQQAQAAVASTNAPQQEPKDFNFAQKNEFTAAMRAQLAVFKTDTDLLEAKLATATEAIKTDLKPKIQSLKDQQVQLSQQLDDIPNATEPSWQNTMSNVKATCAALKTGLEQTRQTITDKSAA